MNKTRISRSVAAVAMAICLGATSLAPSLVFARDKPFNRVVIGIDASGSYKGRQADALAKAKDLLDNAAKQRIKRWEQADEVIVVSLDAIPEVIWRGTTRELKQTDASVWLTQFRGRSDYAKCTDVAAFFNLAAELFAAPPVPTGKYLVVFSDLKAEPPLDSPGKCKGPIPVAQLVQELPWDAFEDVSTTVFWMPVAQKYTWAKVIQEKGLGLAVKLYSESESAGKQLDPPKPAKRKVFAEQKAQSAEAVTSMLGTLGWTLMGLVVVLFGAVGALAIVAHMRRGRNRVGAARHPQSQVVTTGGQQPPQPRPQGTR